MSMRQEISRDLVFDVGMHRGNDTAFYLALGYRVVGIEANPALADFARDRFAREIREGRLTVVEGAIAGAGSGTVTFYRRDGHDGMGSIERNPGIPGFEAEEVTGVVEVAVVDLAECLELHGTPFFMKVDIEGAERFCLEGLAKRPVAPSHLSLEADRTGPVGVRTQIEALCSLGYDRFQLRPQSGIQGSTFRGETLDGRALEFVFEPPSSGPFGDQLEETGFVSVEEILRESGPAARQAALKLRLRKLKRIPGFGRLMSTTAHLLNRAVPLFEWYDLHARRAAVEQRPTPRQTGTVDPADRQ